MTVRELIELLEQQPADMRVVVDGYEQGYDDLSPQQMSIVGIVLNAGVHHWEGRHGNPAHLAVARRADVTTVDALVLSRVSN